MTKPLTLIICLTSLSLAASEVDSFHGRDQKLKDSLAPINQKAHELLIDAVNDANAPTLFGRYRGCDPQHLYQKMRQRFRNHVLDEFTKWITTTSELDKITTPIRQSIYADLSVIQSPIQGGWARINDPTGEILSLQGLRVGTDKFEHFMGSGFSYFETYHLKKRPVTEALAIGWRAETGFMGATMTGVMSFADMVANFQGMRFWNHVLQQDEDIMGENLGPYIVCHKQQWQIARPIDFAPYFDQAFDESINCSKMRTPLMTQRVLARIESYNPNYTCPMDSYALELVRQKYEPWQEWLINLDGLEAMDRDDYQLPE